VGPLRAALRLHQAGQDARQYRLLVAAERLRGGLLRVLRGVLVLVLLAAVLVLAALSQWLRLGACRSHRCHLCVTVCIRLPILR
jgi:hypothetical protein